MNFNPLTVFGRTTMVCAEPENLRGKSLAQVTSSNIVDPGSCPSECVCFTGIADCSSKGETHYQHFNAIYRMSSFSLTWIFNPDSIQPIIIINL